MLAAASYAVARRSRLPAMVEVAIEPLPIVPSAPAIEAIVEPPSKLADDPREHELLAVLRERPGDPDARMVYADMLESRGELAKANYVRGIDRYEDVVAVLQTSDVEWRAIACRERTHACTEASCPRTWDAFEPTDDERIRHCRTCWNVVHYCENVDEEHAWRSSGARAVLDLGGALPVKPAEFRGNDKS